MSSSASVTDIAPTLTDTVSQAPTSSSTSQVPLVSSTISSSASIPTATPSKSTPYVYLGCIADSGTARVLNSTWTFSRTQMTHEFCYNIAKQNGKKYFGIESGYECFVGDALLSNKTITGCDIPCTGKPQILSRDSFC
jgi:hypothetical protein